MVKEKLLVEELYSYEYGMCYAVMPNYKLGTDWNQFIKISLTDSLPADDVPESVDFTITSRNNRFGIVESSWFEGRTFDMSLSAKQKSGIALQLEEHQYNFLPLTSNCNKRQTKYECIAEDLLSNMKNHTVRDF